MPTNFIRYSARGDQNKTRSNTNGVHTEAYPECFGESWDPNDEDYCQLCDAFDECAKELTDRKRASEHRRTNRTSSSSSHSSTTRYNGTTSEHNTGIVRPKTPEGYPPGTEYCDPDHDGEHGVMKRAAAIFWAEGRAAFGNQLGQSLSRFMRDPTNWHKHAGRRRYGENFGPTKKPKRKKSPVNKGS